VVVADHAGSGKTLAYLLPFVQDIHEEEKEAGRATVANCPRLVVICPTEELAAQVAMTCRGISKVGCFSILFNGFFVANQTDAEAHAS
jgi:ATP-dependent RNA helicase DDX18/HAS1